MSKIRCRRVFILKLSSRGERHDLRMGQNPGARLNSKTVREWMFIPYKYGMIRFDRVWLILVWQEMSGFGSPKLWCTSSFLGVELSPAAWIKRWKGGPLAIGKLQMVLGSLAHPDFESLAHPTKWSHLRTLILSHSRTLTTKNEYPSTKNPFRV